MDKNSEIKGLEMLYRAIAIQGGFAVAYLRPKGELCAVSEHAMRTSAEREAQQLNAALAAQKSAETRTRYRQHAFSERKPVRWFEPDAFA